MSLFSIESSVRRWMACESGARVSSVGAIGLLVIAVALALVYVASTLANQGIQ